MKLKRIDLPLEAMVERTKLQLASDKDDWFPPLDYYELMVIKRVLKMAVEKLDRTNDHIILTMAGAGLVGIALKDMMRLVIIADEVEFRFAHVLAVINSERIWAAYNGGITAHQQITFLPRN